MLMRARRALTHRAAALLMLPALLAMAAGCDVITADLRHTEKAEWRKTFELPANGRVDISNINGKITVEPSSGRTVEVVAVKSARGATEQSAKEGLSRIEIRDESTADGVKIATRVTRSGGIFQHGSGGVTYSVKVPADADVTFRTVNGGVEVVGLSGRITAETTNGGIVARDISGSIDASTTNGGVDVDLANVAAGGAKLECTNGGLKLRLPADAKASITASITNGGIDTGGITLQTTESSRRRLQGTLNGGGAPIRLEGTNGGITISRR